MPSMYDVFDPDLLSELGGDSGGNGGLLLRRGAGIEQKQDSIKPRALEGAVTGAEITSDGVVEVDETVSGITREQYGLAILASKREGMLLGIGIAIGAYLLHKFMS